jgi:hypothetical protein
MQSAQKHIFINTKNLQGSNFFRTFKYFLAQHRTLKQLIFSLLLCCGLFSFAQEDNITIFSECKKITSKKNFEKEMKKALKQLGENNIENNNNFYGMIFIDITNVIFEDLKNYLYENKFIIKNQFDGIKLLEKCISEFLSLKSKVIDDLNDKNINISLGTGFYVSIPLLINNEIIFFTTKLDFKVSQYLNDEKFENLKEIISPFEKAFEFLLSNFNSF